MRAFKVRTLLSALSVVTLGSYCPTASSISILSKRPIGPCYTSLYEPISWSPSGHCIAYFSERSFMLADTSGHTWKVKELDLAPRRLLWVNDSTVVLYQWDYLGRDSVIHRLVQVNVADGNETILEKYSRVLLDRNRAEKPFEGPFSTFDGIPYYLKNVNGKKQPVLVLGSQSVSKKSRQVARTIDVREDAIYLVDLSSGLSEKISNKTYQPYMLSQMAVSRDLSHIMFGGYIVRLYDDKLTILDTLGAFKRRPEGVMGCGVGRETFHPTESKVIFQLSCDDGHTFVVDRLFLYDYMSSELVQIDSLLQQTNCEWPRFSPEGKFLAYIQDGLLFIAAVKYEH